LSLLRSLLGFLVQGMRPTKRTVLLHFQLMRNGPFIFGRCIVALLALLAGKRNNISHSVQSSPDI